MCDVHEARGLQTTAIPLLDAARFLAAEPELRRSAIGFIGFGETLAGQKVLLGVDTHYDRDVVDAVCAALRERGAQVDRVTFDAGPDREFDELDEIRVVMRRGPADEVPRRWDYVRWLEDVAGQRGYDLVVHGKGGPIPRTSFRYEAFPWLQKEHFLSAATFFPRQLHTLINEKIWRRFWQEGRGGSVHLTDPEGTDIRWTLWEEYFDNRIGFAETPYWGHIMAHPATPLSPREDATGVVAGTTSHFTRPFPQIRLQVDHGRVTSVVGGGGYGDAWREIEEESAGIQYPCFPRPGLFWLWEAAVGTNPKIRRPSNVHLLSSGGFEWERRRSGVVHMGFGTFWRAPEEDWAAERRLVYGHLHVHLLYPTMTLETTAGDAYRVIENGRLTALDDPEVRDAAARLGDPDEILREDWKADIPGVSGPGSYAEFAADPVRRIYAVDRSR